MQLHCAPTSTGTSPLSVVAARFLGMDLQAPPDHAVPRAVGSGGTCVQPCAGSATAPSSRSANVPVLGAVRPPRTPSLAAPSAATLAPTAPSGAALTPEAPAAATPAPAAPSDAAPPPAAPSGATPSAASCSRATPLDAALSGAAPEAPSSVTPFRGADDPVSAWGLVGAAADAVAVA